MSNFDPRIMQRVCAFLRPIAFILPLILATTAYGTPLTLSITATDHHGFQVSCFGGKDGAIDLTVTGGTAPYTYTWSTGATAQDISGLAAGYYAVVVRDDAGGSARAEITLNEPSVLKYDATVQEYPNGFNISCFQCFNGNIQFTPSGGVAPYSYLWRDGVTTQNRSGLGEDALSVTITDLNGCQLESETFMIRSPDRTDWTMGGNAGTDPNTQYIGTSDNKDVVLKSNGQERLRLLADGHLKMAGLGVGPLAVRSDGVLHAGNDILAPPIGPCTAELTMQFWQSFGNTFETPPICPNSPHQVPVLGPLNEHPLSIITNGQERIFINEQGRVGIGTRPPNNPNEQYRLFVEDGIVTHDVLVKAGPWPDFVFDPAYELPSFSELRQYIRTNRHLPAVPSAKEVADKGGVELGDVQAKLLRTLEEQTLYILQLEERLSRMEQRLKVLEPSK